MTVVDFIHIHVNILFFDQQHYFVGGPQLYRLRAPILCHSKGIVWLQDGVLAWQPLQHSRGPVYRYVNLQGIHLTYNMLPALHTLRMGKHYQLFFMDLRCIELTQLARSHHHSKRHLLGMSFQLMLATSSNPPISAVTSVH